MREVKNNVLILTGYGVRLERFIENRKIMNMICSFKETCYRQLHKEKPLMLRQTQLNKKKDKKASSTAIQSG